MTINTHPIQLLDGDRVSLLVGALTVPARPSATKLGGVLTFADEPTEMLESTGSTQANLSLNRNNQMYRLLNDNGWEQSKILSRGFQFSVTSYFVTGIDAADPQLDEAFALLKEASLSKEDELYVKIRRHLGTYAQSTITYDRYYTEAGTVKVTEFTQNMPANGLVDVNVTLFGQGQLYAGTENVAQP